MKCPICNAELVERDQVFVCQRGHGTLMAGKLLGELKKLDFPDEPASGEARADDKKPLTCPHCSAQMQKVNYNDSGIIIDACTNCPYRWLNAGEIKKIEDFKPNIHPQDLLFLESLKEKTDAVAASADAEDTENPEVPLYSGGWGGFIRGNMAGNDNRTLGWLLGAGMYGLIGFAILFYLIFKEVRVIVQDR
jgi:Zn-finger nucleic acid-binding protein